jgi:hypothetical protein
MSTKTDTRLYIKADIKADVKADIIADIDIMRDGDTILARNVSFAKYKNYSSHLTPTLASSKHSGVGGD